MTKKENAPENDINAIKKDLEYHANKFKYNQEKQQYDNLGSNVVNALKKFLNEKDISYLEVYHRVKETKSFLEKIERKNYVDPFDEIEDICGIRIICYYPDDINRIRNIVSEEFEIVEDSDKSNLLKDKEFGYRSHHFIARIKKEWTKAPNYRDLDDLKFEIQVRTILMHAWAEIEHKLNYKTEEEVPSAYKRKLFILSALLENADDQFDNLRGEILGYKNHIKEEIISNKGFDLNQEFNIETFKAFINSRFQAPYNFKEVHIKTIFEDLIALKIGFKEISKSINTVEPYFEEIIEDFKNNLLLLTEIKGITVLFFTLDVTIDKFYKHRQKLDLFEGWVNLVTKWRKKIKKNK